MFKRILKNTTYLFISRIISNILFLVLIIFIAKYLGTQGLGQYTFVIAFGSILFILANLGLEDLTTREVVRNKAKTGIYLGNFLLIKLVAGIFIYIIMFILINLIIKSIELKIATYIVGVIFILETFTSVCYSIFYAYEKMKYQSIILPIRDFIIVGITISFLIFGYGIVEIMLIFLFGKLIETLANFFVMYKYFARPIFKIDFSFWKWSIIQAFPFLVIGLFYSIIYRINTIFLQIFDGENVVGLYEAAYSVIRNLEVFPWFFIISIYPSFSRYYLENNKGKLIMLYKKSIFYLVVFCIVFLIGVFMLGKPLILLIFGEEFAKSALILKLVSIGAFFMFMNMINIYFLNAIDRQIINIYFFLTVAIFHIFVGLLLISRHSFIGAAITVIVSYTLLFMGETSYVRKIIRNLKVSNY